MTLATIHCGMPECIVRIEGYDFDNYIPAAMSDAIEAALPTGWFMDRRGSRLEVYPPRSRPRITHTTVEEHGSVVAKACEQAGLTTIVK